jgi:hypothetical protein
MLVMPYGQKEYFMAYLTNAFSLNMLLSFDATIKTQEISAACAAEMVKNDSLTSAVGHTDTAAVFSSVLGMPVPMSRVTVSLVRGDIILVGQYSGIRLPEGATTLPPGSRIRWVRVTIE